MAKYHASVQMENQKTAGSITDSGGNLFSFLLDSVKFKHPNLCSAEHNVKVMELLKEQFLASQLYEPPVEGHVYPAGESQDPYEDDDMSIVSSRSNEGVAEDFFDVLIQIQSTKGQNTKKGKTTKDPPIGKNTLWFFTEFRIVWI